MVLARAFPSSFLLRARKRVADAVVFVNSSRVLCSDNYRGPPVIRSVSVSGAPGTT